MRVEILDISLNTVERVKKFVQYTNNLPCNVDVLQGRYVIDGKSIMGIFSLDITDAISVQIESDNDELIDKFIFLMEEFR